MSKIKVVPNNTTEPPIEILAARDIDTYKYFFIAKHEQYFDRIFYRISSNSKWIWVDICTQPSVSEQSTFDELLIDCYCNGFEVFAYEKS